MPCLTTERISELTAELAAINDQLTAAKAAKLLAYGKPASYKLETGEGSQQVKNRSIAELREEIRFLEGEKRNIIGKLTGKGLTIVRVRR